MQLYQLETFVAVARSGSFTGAAQELNLTQPAVSQHIKALESEYRLKLVDRSTSPARLTEAGLLLYERATDLLRRVDDTRRAVEDLRTGQAGLVRLGAGSITCIYTLPQVLGAFREKWPGISIAISSGTTRDVLALLDSGAADVGIVTSPVNAQWAWSTPLFCDEIVLAGSGTLPGELEKGEPGEQANRVSIGREELQGWPLVAFKKGQGFREFIDEFLLREGLQPDIRLELDNVEAIKELARAGLGLAFVPRSALRSEDWSSPSSLSLVTIRGVRPLSRTTSMVRRHDGYVSPACGQFMSFVTDWFATRSGEEKRYAATTE